MALPNWIQRILNRLGLPAGASISVDIAALKTALDALGLQYVEGSVSDVGPAAADFDTDLAEATDNHYNGMLLMFTDGDCAGQAHVINDYDGAAKNVSFSAEDIWTEAPGDGDNFIILPSIGTMAKAIYTSLATHDTDIKALLATIAGYIDTEVGAIETKLDTPATFMADVSGITTAGPTKAEMDTAHALLATVAKQNKMRFPLPTQWSEGKIQVQITAAGATIALPTITIANLPTNATIVEAHLMFKFRMIENKHAGVNKLNGATDPGVSQVIQIQDDGGGAWTDAITFVDDFFTLASETREGGDVIGGTPNVGVANVVDGNDTYNVQFLLGKADQDFINFDDVQVMLQISYSI